MDGSYSEQAVLGKIEHLLQGLYHIFHDVSARMTLSLFVDLILNEIELYGRRMWLASARYCPRWHKDYLRRATFPGRQQLLSQ